MFTRNFLQQYRNKALRRGVLYKALNKEERMYFNLTIKIVSRVRSLTVGRIIVRILSKLKDALRSTFVKRMEEYGYKRAKEIATLADNWGNKAARNWSSNKSFVRYLTLIEVNGSSKSIS